MKLFAATIVLGFGGFLIVLAVLSAIMPSKAAHFLGSFASSAKAHFIEIGIRIIVGTALIFVSSEMFFSPVFYFFGWIIIATSIGLLLIPWRFHQKFSQRSVPPVIRHLKLFAFGAFTFGAFIFYGISLFFFG
ncbi:hypothetical protein BH20ACI4_BH20ACI4_06840 [soil metagenome]